MIEVAPRPGDVLPPLERTVTLTDMVAYAGATWDWHRLHYDPDYVRAKGLPAPIVDGQLFGALLVEQLQDWAGPHSFVHKLQLTFKAVVFAGEAVRCEATVRDVAGNDVVVDQQVVVIDHAGRQQRVAVAPASAHLLLHQAGGPGPGADGGGGP